MDNILEIFVITYNRSNLLNSTLSSLVESIPNCVRINVIDNNSTDNTQDIVVDFINEGNNVRYVKNKVNIGANANILRCFEYSQSKYTWILGDDDQYNLKNFNLEFLYFLKEIDLKLIHVGAHDDPWHFGGRLDTPENLIIQGYPYFKYSSFIGCNIFDTQLFIRDFLLNGYNNIINSYPHMPYLFDIYKGNEVIFVSKEKFVNAIWKHQNYSHDEWMTWWFCNALTYTQNKDKRLVFLNHFNNELSDEVIKGLKRISKDKNFTNQVKYFVYHSLILKERVLYRTYKIRKVKLVNFSFRGISKLIKFIR